MNDRLRGVIIPAATPFDEHGDISIRMMEENYEKWNRTPVCGYMCLGTNGEFKSLSDEESLLVIRRTACLKGKKTLIAGVGRESLRLTLDFIRKVAALDADIDYLSVLTPSYFGKLMDDAALCEYYKTVADQSPIPILIYVAPGYANGVALSPSALATLAGHPNIHGVKDTSKDMMVDYMLKAGQREDFTVLAGSLQNLVTCLAFGGSGGVVSAANYFPEECARITELYFSGLRDEALDYYIRLQKLVKKSGARYGVAGLKACMNLMGYSAGVPRLPVMPLTREKTEAIGEILKAEKLSRNG